MSSAKRGHRGGDLTLRAIAGSPKTFVFWFLAFLALVALVGGGSRGDIASLALLRPAAVLICVAALWGMSGAELRQHRWFFWLAGLITLLAGLHLVPLPAALWQPLPGRETIIAIDQTVQRGPQWRPITISEEAGWNTFYSLFVPISVGLGMMRLDGPHRQALLTGLVAVAIAGLALSILQMMFPGAGVLWPFRASNPGFAVGFFANKNHNAVFLAAMLPLLVAWVRRPGVGFAWSVRMLVACGAALVIVLVIGGSGSRAGLVALAAGIAGAFAVIAIDPDIRQRIASYNRQRVVWFAMAVVVAAIVGAIAFILAGSAALERLRGSAVDGIRVGIWETVLEGVKTYFPIGSGSGSFVEAYAMDEKVGHIVDAYVNHAHNDFLEVALTLGLPGVMLLAAALGLFAWWSWQVWVTRRKVASATLGRAASIALAILIGASAVDYPVRTPMLVSLVVILAFWLRGAAQRSASAATLP